MTASRVNARRSCHVTVQAQILHSDPEISAAGFKAASHAWDLILTAHQVSAQRTGLAKLLGEVYWVTYWVNQVAFRQLAHYKFTAHQYVVDHLTRMFSTIGDSKVIEDTINVCSLDWHSGMHALDC